MRTSSMSKHLVQKLRPLLKHQIRRKRKMLIHWNVKTNSGRFRSLTLYASTPCAKTAEIITRQTLVMK